ncbi:hypothetical protein DB347_00610 [Opitutaceae bacterium EW11]|nr:hypothetical protein DB347_00610 [Opitutaceae bacterium EW11]
MSANDSQRRALLAASSPAAGRSRTDTDEKAASRPKRAPSAPSFHGRPLSGHSTGAQPLPYDAKASFHLAEIV